MNFETPSPYAILPTPESILGLDNSMTQNVPSSIGTTTSWSPANTPTQLANTIQRSRKIKSSAKKQSNSTLKSRSRHSRTPFDRQHSQPMSPMLVQALCPSLPQGIAPLDQDSGIEVSKKEISQFYFHFHFTKTKRLVYFTLQTICIFDLCSARSCELKRSHVSDEIYSLT